MGINKGRSSIIIFEWRCIVRVISVRAVGEVKKRKGKGGEKVLFVVDLSIFFVIRCNGDSVKKAGSKNL